MNPEIGGIAAGLNKAIQDYMGVNIQNMQTQFQHQQQQATALSNAKELSYFNKALDHAFKEPSASIKFAQLKSVNPAFAKMGLSDDMDIPLKDLADLGSVLPKDKIGADNYLSLNEAAQHLYMLGVPDEKINSIVDRFKKNGVDRVLRSSIDDAGEAQGGKVSYNTKLRIFAQNGIDTKDPNFETEFTKFSQTIDSVFKEPRGAQQSLPAGQDEAVAKQASDLHDKYIAEGLSSTDAMNKIVTQLGEAYDAPSVQRVIGKIDHIANPPVQSNTTFRSALKKLIKGK